MILIQKYKTAYPDWLKDLAVFLCYLMIGCKSRVIRLTIPLVSLGYTYKTFIEVEELPHEKK